MKHDPLEQRFLHNPSRRAFALQIQHPHKVEANQVTHMRKRAIRSPRKLRSKKQNNTKKQSDTYGRETGTGGVIGVGRNNAKNTQSSRKNSNDSVPPPISPLEEKKRRNSRERRDAPRSHFPKTITPMEGETWCSAAANGTQQSRMERKIRA